MGRFFLFVLIFFMFINVCYGENKDPNSSENLMKKAAECFEKKDYKGVIKYAKRCIQFYKSQALAMMHNLKDYPQGDDVFNYWALNDVAYAYFLLGRVYMEQGKTERAKKMFLYVIKRLKYAQVYDPSLNGFWKVSVACQEKLDEISFSSDKAGNSNNGGMNKFEEMKRKIEEMKKRRK